jgi:hypothetical protein
MSKIQVTTALERQLPEFIREDYTTFVKFVKAYYEFLGQTNSRNLEDIRSIDKTLDAFVAKFKKELAAIFPTANIQNERMFLEHISDFYNSRGSVESYQLLFRVLFNKNSDIFYPSTQILKVSDGKWIQDKSVFVKAVSGDIFSMKGKIITLKTAKKIIEVFCPNVLLYRDDIYEVFLDKQYYNDLAIGEIVEFNTASGVILPCPAKYKISNEGAGFEIGSIYNLPTATGNGSTIKITRVGSLGEIKAIQIITFGLDYDTNFYAKLSNKSTQALAFYHPITQYIAGTPRNVNLEPTASYGVPNENPASQDQISDYLNFGYFVNQDYFYYDLTYVPVEFNALTSSLRPDMAQTVWFADTSYVGDIIASFYTNESGVVIDEDTAEIKIDLGAVAVYPGYYATNDGFISDEIYIQDGDYYQQFSYVVKIEEQLENYKNIVKSLLQPTGLKLFGEFNIYKNFDVIATPLLAFIRRQFFDQITQINDFTTSNIGKFVSDTYIGDYAETTLKDVGKFLQEPITPLDDIYKDVAKILDWDTQNNYVNLIDNDISAKNVGKNVSDTLVAFLEYVEKSLTRINEDYTSIVDGTIYKDITKEIAPEYIDSISDIILKTMGLNKSEEQFVSELLILKDLELTKTEILNLIIDLQYKDFTTQYSDNIAAVQPDSKFLDWSSGVNGTFYKTLSFEEVLFQRIVDYKRDPSDISTIIENSFNRDIATAQSDSVPIGFAISRIVDYIRSFGDNITGVGEEVDIVRAIILSDDIGLAEAVSTVRAFVRSFADDIQALEAISKVFTMSTIQDSMTISEGQFFIGLLYNRSFEDYINSFIEGSTLYFDPYSATTTTAELTDDYFSQEYAVVSTISIT